MTSRTQQRVEYIEVITDDQWRAGQRPRYDNAQRKMLVNAALIAAMIAAAIYAPVASQPQLVGLVSKGLANLLAQRGVNWQAAWHQASLLMMGR